MEEKVQAPANKPAEVVSTKTGAIGLDIGTSRIVMADSSAQKDSRSQLNAFVAVPSSEMAENVLKHKNMVYERNCKNLYVYGNDSNFFASFLNVEARRPMRDGLLNAQEEMSQHIMQLIIQRIVPRGRGKEMLYFSVPGKGDGVNGKLVYHEAVLRSYLQSLGYNARSINEGQAVVFSELQEENFTGIGISFGGGMCNVSVSFMSMPMITFSIPKGGDYIDRNVTEVLGEANSTKGAHRKRREPRPLAPAQRRPHTCPAHLLRRCAANFDRPVALRVQSFEPVAEDRPPDAHRPRGRHGETGGLPAKV
jgi:actin-like ATPase involved in cell morphogenesis